MVKKSVGLIVLFSQTIQLREAERKVEESSKEQEALIDIFSEERTRRDREEENLRKKLKVRFQKKFMPTFACAATSVFVLVQFPSFLVPKRCLSLC